MMVSSLKAQLLRRFKQPFFLREWSPTRHISSQAQEALSPSFGLYSAANLSHCPWPQNSEGEYAKKFLIPLMQEGVHHYIENVQTELYVLVGKDWVLPLTVNESEYKNSYVCSPYSYFISYALHSLDSLTRAWVNKTVYGLLQGMAKVLRRYQINKAVSVNNWLLSTNFYPNLSSIEWEEVVQFLQRQFPKHAIVFRSIDPQLTPHCFEALKALDLHFIASREIFFINPEQTTFFESRLFKSDLRLLNKSGYEIVDGSQLLPTERERVLQLYRDVYIDKHSELNPQLTENFLRLTLEENLMTFKVLKKDGRIDGVVGYLQRHGMMLCPFIGYDQTLQEASLYRMLCTILILEARQHRLLFHQSSGASTFKKIRKSQSCIEYTAVCSHHLPLHRQLPWNLLKTICNSIGIYFMKRY